MRLVVGVYSFSQPGGTETSVLTVAQALQRLGHEVVVAAEELGPMADHAERLAVPIARTPWELPESCDAVIANDAVITELLAGRYPGTRLIFLNHSAIFDHQLPSLADGVVSAVVVPSERFGARVRAMPLAVPVVRLRQPIDTDRFVPGGDLPPRPRRALVLSNYLRAARRDALVGAWTDQGVEFTFVGAFGESQLDPVAAIQATDIVVGKARAALEGMACGRAVYVFDEFGGDGWVTPEVYAAFEDDGFSGRSSGMPLDRARLRADLAAYDPDMGWLNREVAVTHHAARDHASRLVELLRGGMLREEDCPHPAAELSRHARAAWTAERRALEAERQRDHWQARALTAERDAPDRAAELIRHARAAETAERRALAAEGQRDHWQARALEAERDAQEMGTLLTTRRVRFGIGLGRWLDRLRGR